jgi:CHAD domain-containing protein
MSCEGTDADETGEAASFHLATRFNGTLGMEHSTYVLHYAAAQVRAIETHLSPAVYEQLPESVHQARVATRRLKSALAIATQVVGTRIKRLNALADAGRKLRKRLGGLRDADVMIDRIESLRGPRQLTRAIDWRVSQLKATRESAIEAVRRKVDVPALQDVFAGWPLLMRSMLSRSAEIDTAHAATRAQLSSRFVLDGDKLAACYKGPHEIDIHELRIAGKELRYTLEMLGGDQPAALKKLQDDLGEWHDWIVLLETSWQPVARTDPLLQTSLNALAETITDRARQSLAQFRRHWPAAKRGL